MSPKNRKQRRKGFQFKHAGLILGGLLLIAAAFWLFRGSKSNGNDGGTGMVGGTPAISVDQKAIDFGDLKDFTSKTISIKVTNTGTGTLRLTDQPYIQVVKGCCPPALSAGRLSLAPGQSTMVTSASFFMHPGMDGPHDFAVHIKTNDPSQPDLVVHVVSNWSQ